MVATGHAPFLPALFVTASLLCPGCSCLAFQEMDESRCAAQVVAKRNDCITQYTGFIQTNVLRTKIEDFRLGDPQPGMDFQPPLSSWDGPKSKGIALTEPDERPGIPVDPDRGPMIPQADIVDTREGHDILILVLGYGEPERRRELGSTLRFLVGQAPAVQCIVFVWNTAASTHGFPSNCRIISAQGAFLSFLLEVPQTMLDAAEYIFLMADDVDLRHTFKPVNLIGLKTAMERFQLDIVSPSMEEPVHYAIMKPSADSWGRLVDFIEWQAQMLTKQATNALMLWLQPQITGCWGYDFFIYQMLIKQNMTGRIGILNTMVMTHNHPSDGLALDAVKASACGHIGPHGEHFASEEITSYFQQHGLEKSTKVSFGPLL